MAAKTLANPSRGLALRNPIAPPRVFFQDATRGIGAGCMLKRVRTMKHKRAKMFALAALALGVSTVAAEAANCQGRRDTGTAVGAVGGGLIGNAASHGSVGGTVAGAVIGGVAGNLIGGSNCVPRQASRY